MYHIYKKSCTGSDMDSNTSPGRMACSRMYPYHWLAVLFTSGTTMRGRRRSVVYRACHIVLSSKPNKITAQVDFFPACHVMISSKSNKITAQVDLFPVLLDQIACNEQVPCPVWQTGPEIVADVHLAELALYVPWHGIPVIQNHGWRILTGHQSVFIERIDRWWLHCHGSAVDCSEQYVHWRHFPQEKQSYSTFLNTLSDTKYTISSCTYIIYILSLSAQWQTEICCVQLEGDLLHSPSFQC